MVSIDEIKEGIERRQRVRRTGATVGLLVVLTLTAAGATYLGFTIAEIVRQFGTWTEFLSAFLSPDFSEFTVYSRQNGLAGLDAFFGSLLNPSTLLSSSGLQWSGTLLLGSAVATIIIGFTGTVIGFPLALTFGILGSERVTPFPFNFIFRGIMSSIRAIPALVWILIYVPLVGISPEGAMLAVATDTIGNLGRLFTDELEEIEDGPIEAIESTGAKRPQVVFFGMLSQVSNGFIAWTLYVLEINTRIAISLGVVGAGGIGQYIELAVRGFRYGEAAAGIFVVIVIVLSVEMLSSRVRARLRPGEHEGKGLLDSLRDLGDGGKWFGASKQ
ncbi:phosphonate ABC transporter, permease protein PhnE [Halorussus halobius]|uniref:phosphonate ABC transporter, permease protein PhnE n=1 Tax=Halorussus halobius TaxID=1710537 RepID=UPI001092CF62|nr:phosphonate ABC transporter, permease protein PhnE [Halorussus halobius]